MNKNYIDGEWAEAKQRPTPFPRTLDASYRLVPIMSSNATSKSLSGQQKVCHSAPVDGVVLPTVPLLSVMKKNKMR